MGFNSGFKGLIYLNYQIYFINFQEIIVAYWSSASRCERKYQRVKRKNSKCTFLL